MGIKQTVLLSVLLDGYSCLTCAVESISFIATSTVTDVTSNGIHTISIFITVIQTIGLALIDIYIKIALCKLCRLLHFDFLNSAISVIANLYI